MKLKQLAPARQQILAFTLVETLVAVLILGTISLSLFGAFSAGISTVQAARENMRATQILVQKMETVRLFTWNQGTQNNLASTNFLSYYDPSSTNQMGTVYRGRYTPSPTPDSIPSAYRSNMRMATVTVYWTNYGRGKTPIVQSRQMQTFVARYGMQNYVY
jgi:type II secretory pathway pseudopilin PulG